MTQLRKPFDVRYFPAQSAREASGGYSQCGYVITGYGPWREVNCRVTGYVLSYDTFIPLYTCDLVRDPIYSYQCTYIPYVPAAPASPARVETTPRIGWDAGAQSAVSRVGDCQLEFSIDPVVGTYVGLSADSADVTDTSRFRYAFYLHQANYQNQYAVIVDGEQCTAPAPYTAETVFKIRRLGEKVEFRVDDDVVHTDAASTDPLYAATTIYASGDAVPELDSCCTPPTQDLAFVSPGVYDPAYFETPTSSLGVWFRHDSSVPEWCSTELATALSGASSVRITKVAPTGVDVCDLLAGDGIIRDLELGDPLPPVTFTAVDWPCSRYTTEYRDLWGVILPGVVYAYPEAVWIAVEVDGNTYYGLSNNSSWFPCG